MSNYNVLDKIEYPKDIRKLTFQELSLLSDDISKYIHTTITEIGGHYASPLGAVDLTLALHYAYNTPLDKLVWDVGHQAYAHKIITGRKDDFRKIRKYNGISGFLKIDESEYDAFGAGHASTSVSAALGLAHARDKSNQNHQVVAIIGDGALTGGMAYEGLNNLGYHKTQMTVVLNDNSYSISKSVGALSKYLTRIVTNPTYNKIRNDIWNLSNKIPTFSSTLKHFIRKTEGSIKAYLTPGILFEELGLRYIGPIDGHNIENMINVFKSIKTMNTPVLLHVHTNKSKSIDKESKDAIKYYSLSGKKIKSENNNQVSFSKSFGDSLYKLADSNDFHCVTAAMGIGTGLDKYADRYKDRYIDVGIAEEHAVTYAAGLSAGGILPIVAIYSTFMQRAYDSIIHDVALQKLPMILCMDRAGLVGNDGPTHHGVFDVGFMLSIPNFIVTAPKDGNELLDILYLAIVNKLLLSIRYPKQLTNFDVDREVSNIQVGSWEILKKGTKVCILTFGSMINSALQAYEYIEKTDNLLITIVNCRFIKPIDEKLLNELIASHDFFITIEEGILSGGFGNYITNYFNKNRYEKKITCMGIDDTFTTHGNRDELLMLCNLDLDSIIKNIKNYINEK